MHPNDDRRLKINEVKDHPRKRQADQKWVDQEEEEREYSWGFTRKIRMVPLTRERERERESSQHVQTQN
jgi:hypothetical protein